MRIFIDIGHPAHVHYFKNFYQIMSEKGHDFLITARQKEVSHELLEAYHIPYKTRGKGSNQFLGKILYLPKADLFLLKEALRFKPDIFLSFASPYAAQVSAILRKPHIAFDDTEHAKLGQLFYRPFTKLILSPRAYMGKRSAKQKFFNGYMELCYLHPNYFTPNESVLNLLSIDKNERYTVLRFVSWNANHDTGHSGISLENKRKAVQEFLKFGRVFISSEGKLPKDLEAYQISVPPARMHDVLNYATLFYGESATMASESAMLGTPGIYLDNAGRGYTNDLEKNYGLVYNFNESEEDQISSIQKGVELLQNENLKEKSKLKREQLLKDKIDVTSFMVELVENYPGK
jgi:predicted glycosyltransferase